jgi:hypothetical protein
MEMPVRPNGPILALRVHLVGISDIAPHEIRLYSSILPSRTYKSDATSRHFA